jgi:hypothetical protein
MEIIKSVLSTFKLYDVSEAESPSVKERGCYSDGLITDDLALLFGVLDYLKKKMTEADVASETSHKFYIAKTVNRV